MGEPSGVDPREGAGTEEPGNGAEAAAAEVGEVHQRRHGDPPRFREAFRFDGEIARELLEAHLALHQDFALVGDVRTSDLFARLLTRFVDRFATHDADPGLGRLALARDYLHAHLADDVSLADVAEVVGLRPRQVINLFNRHLGLPPHAYHLVLRVNAVKRMLRDGEPPADCAAAVGFYDQPHMTRHFRAMVGLSARGVKPSRPMSLLPVRRGVATPHGQGEPSWSLSGVGARRRAGVDGRTRGAMPRCSG